MTVHFIWNRFQETDLNILKLELFWEKPSLQIILIVYTSGVKIDGIFATKNIYPKNSFLGIHAEQHLLFHLCSV